MELTATNQSSFKLSFDPNLVSVHGKTKMSSNYNVNSPVDLTKLFLPDYLAVFPAFDKSMDLSAALRLL